MRQQLQLQDPVTELKFISDKYAGKLAKLEIETVADLITHFPRYHKDTSEITPINDIALTGEYTVAGQIHDFKSIRLRGGKQMQKATLVDDSGSLAITWWNQRYLADTFKRNKDQQVILHGKVNFKRGMAEMVSPQFDIADQKGETIHLGGIVPTYALTAGISAKWLRRRIKEVLSDYQLEITSPIDSFTKTNLDAALHGIHFPEDLQQAETAKKRLGLEELAAILLEVEAHKAAQLSFPAPSIETKSDIINQFTDSLPFQLTDDQRDAIGEVLADTSKAQPMNRLVQGDVGSGKTVVAVAVAINALEAGFDVVLLAPTTVLAEQHHQSIGKMLAAAGYGTAVNLVTGTTKKSLRNDDAAQIFIGTTALLARKDQLFGDQLGLIIVDEQHKFGVKQRAALQEFVQAQKLRPHMLDMTATPIPRTIALTLFGDVDITTIKSKPKNRLPISTHLVPAGKRKDSYKWIKEQVGTGRQVYWICPLIEDSEQMDVKSAKSTYQQLSAKVFAELNVGLLHGKLKEKEKLKVMDDFKSGEIDILVSTTVIEVGIDVPNATIIVIEDADRLGLAQLHQLRGRVGRGELQSWCFVYESSGISEKGQNRLKYFADHRDGLEIAEYDLSLRGPGEVYGTRQSGIPNLKIARLDDLKMIDTAKKIAKQLFSDSATLPLFADKPIKE